MDHSNLAGQKYPHGQCRHGRCLDHGPEWENVGEKRREPNPGIFGKKTYRKSRCCGQPMARYKEVQTKRCKKCGRTEDHIENYLALCLCCGYHFDTISYASYSH
ncbi:MAG: hypothetical protein HYT43_02050 [Candidatus Taylorbacteria bacterium]|nr:hypothetical protein [Candidatus Taylorbacteria bacterium]